MDILPYLDELEAAGPGETKSGPQPPLPVKPAPAPPSLPSQKSGFTEGTVLVKGEKGVRYQIDRGRGREIGDRPVSLVLAAGKHRLNHATGFKPFEVVGGQALELSHSLTFIEQLVADAQQAAKNKNWSELERLLAAVTKLSTGRVPSREAEVSYLRGVMLEARLGLAASLSSYNQSLGVAVESRRPETSAALDALLKRIAPRVVRQQYQRRKGGSCVVAKEVLWRPGRIELGDEIKELPGGHVLSACPAYRGKVIGGMRKLLRACCAAFVFVLALLVALSDYAAQGQVQKISPHSTSGASDAAKALPASIQAALNKDRDKGDLRQARQLLEQAYRTEKTERRPLFLFFLGRVSAAQGQRIDAADYYRRYLALVAPESSGRALWEESSRFLRTFLDPVAELQVRGPTGAMLYVGTHLVGELRLPDTVFVPGGAHLFTLDYGNKRYSTPNAKSFPAESISVVQLNRAPPQT